MQVQWNLKVVHHKFEAHRSIEISDLSQRFNILKNLIWTYSQNLRNEFPFKYVALMHIDNSAKHQNKGNQIVNLSEDFALKMLSKCRTLKSIGEFELANQLFKSSTSVGANIAESQHAESKADFVHKLKIAAKEARESEFWMKLIEQSDIEIDFRVEAEILLSIQKLLSSIISTCMKSKFK